MSVPGESRPAQATPLWGGRFEGRMAPEMARINDSLAIDFRLWREDIRGSRAWARALVDAGVLTADEAGRLRAGLDAVAERLERTGRGDASDEDIHSLVERLLFEEVGEVAGKLHTGRSRNDQLATDLRLWGMEAGRHLDAAVISLQNALIDLAERSMDVIMPGYTHLQQGQPIRAAQWALAHFWPLRRDRSRLSEALQRVSVLPLGSGALAGCPFDVDRRGLASQLGFRAISENSVDAVSDRDWVAELSFCGALIGVHLSRLGEDLVLFASTEFGFLRLGDEYCTGSSLMPQKRNPDVAELTRGKTGRLAGNLVAVLTLLKGLPTGYNRDLQEEKERLFDTMDTLLVVLPAMAGAVASASFQAERVAAALNPQLLATDLAEYLVRKGVPFRASHEAVGRLVRRAEERSETLDELPDEVFRDVHPAFGSDVRDVFSWEQSVEARRVPGGTARASVERQIFGARAAAREDEPRGP